MEFTLFYVAPVASTLPNYSVCALHGELGPWEWHCGSLLHRDGSQAGWLMSIGIIGYN